tara:strand:+ start:434 stop:817 length:384 start_codon:yes stop_codon:yes gene_type:complete
MPIDSTKYITFFIVVIFIHVVVNVVFSKLILDWKPTGMKRIYMLATVWLIPVLGIFIIYKRLNLNWFSSEDGSKRTAGVSISFLEMDAIFNPGSKHVVEEQQREKTEVRKEGELVDGAGVDAEEKGR